MDAEFLKYKFGEGHYGVITKQKFKIGVRHLQMLYMLVSAIVLGIVRGSMGVAVLAITDDTRRDDTYIQIHNWDRRALGAILSSFFFGYAMMIVPSELFLKRIGGKWVLTAMLFVNGVLCAAMPTIVNKGGWVAVCNAKLFMGMAHGCFSSVYQSLMDNWLPPNEKSIFNCIVYGGVQLGIIIGLPASGVVSQLRLGWELIYYSLAMMTLAMAVLYGTLTASTPYDHQAVGDLEKEYISDSLHYYRKKVLPKPWKKILKSPAFWATASAHAASNAVFVFFLADVPAYLKTFDLSLNNCAWITMLPFISMWASYISTAPTLEWLSSTRCLSYIVNVTHYRKAINAAGTFGIVIGLTVLPNLGPERLNLAIIILSAILGLTGFQFSGFLSNYKDMSENYSGILMMVSSAFSSVIGAIVPFASGLIVADDPSDMKRWRTVFVFLASLNVLGNVAYTVLATNERQHWDHLVIRKKFGQYNCVIDPTQVQLDELSQPKPIQVKHENDTEF